MAGDLASLKIQLLQKARSFVRQKCEMPGFAVQVAGARRQNLLDAERPDTAITHLSSNTGIPTQNVQSTSTEATARAVLPQAGCFHVAGLCRQAQLYQVESQPMSQSLVSSREHHQRLSGRMLKVWGIGAFLMKRREIEHLSWALLFALEHELAPWLLTNIPWPLPHSLPGEGTVVSLLPHSNRHHRAQCEGPACPWSVPHSPHQLKPLLMATALW